MNLRTLAAAPDLRRKINKLGGATDRVWNLEAVERLANAMAFLLWQAWDEKLPGGTATGSGYRLIFRSPAQGVSVVNFYIGLAKGAIFGMVIALIACHFGFLIKPNIESLGKETTRAWLRRLP